MFVWKAGGNQSFEHYSSSYYVQHKCECVWNEFSKSGRKGKKKESESNDSLSPG